VAGLPEFHVTVLAADHLAADGDRDAAWAAVVAAIDGRRAALCGWRTSCGSLAWGRSARSS
jgi:hypothetical protein